MIPAIPNAGTGLTVPLVTPAYYQAVTGATVAQDVIDEATVIAEQWCLRTLAHGTYTERLYVNYLGMVYPSALPIDPAGPVTPAGGDIQGFGIWVGYFTPLPDMPVWTGVLPAQTDVTYTGGYQPVGTTGGPTPGLPPRLARAICKIAWFLTNPAQLAGMPGGVKATNASGVSVSGDLSSMVLTDTQLERDLNRFRRPQARAWDQ